MLSIDTAMVAVVPVGTFAIHNDADELNNLTDPISVADTPPIVTASAKSESFVFVTATITRRLDAALPIARPVKLYDVAFDVLDAVSRYVSDS